MDTPEGNLNRNQRRKKMATEPNTEQEFAFRSRFRDLFISPLHKQKCVYMYYVGFVRKIFCFCGILIPIVGKQENLCKQFLNRLDMGNKK